MILLDTHVLIWSQGRSRKLSRAADSAIRRAQRSGGIAISIITVVELAALLRRGKISLRGGFESTILEIIADVAVQPIALDTAVMTAQLPSDFSNDPADRIIAATSITQGLPLVTADQRMLDCPLLKTIW